MRSHTTKSVLHFDILLFLLVTKTKLKLQKNWKIESKLKRKNNYD